MFAGTIIMNFATDLTCLIFEPLSFFFHTFVETNSTLLVAAGAVMVVKCGSSCKYYTV